MGVVAPGEKNARGANVASPSQIRVSYSFFLLRKKRSLQMARAFLKWSCCFETEHVRWSVTKLVDVIRNVICNIQNKQLFLVWQYVLIVYYRMILLCVLAI